MKASKRKRPLRSDRTSGAAPPLAQCRSLPVPLPACTPLVHSPVGSRSSFYGHFLFIQCHFPCSRLGRAPPCRALAHCGCSQYRRQHPETEPHVDEAEPAAPTALPLGRENSRRSSVIDEVLHPCHICTGTALTAATSAPGLRSPLPHLHRDCADCCLICTATGLTAATSAPPLGSPLPCLHGDWAHRCHICTATGLRCSTGPTLGQSGAARSPSQRPNCRRLRRRTCGGRR